MERQQDCVADLADLHAPENLALLRRLALNILTGNQDKGSLRSKIKWAGWDDRFLLQLLAGA